MRDVVERSAVQGSLDVGETEHILAARRRCGAPLLRRILRDWETIDSTSPNTRTNPDLRSELEARLLALIAAEGLPTPACDRLLQLDSYRVIRFTYRQVEREPGAVVAAIGRLLDDSTG